MKRFLFALVLATVPAAAHEAPDGWEYDRDCCSSRDCHPYPSENVTLIPGGYQTVDGEVVMANETRRRWSGDGRYHRCDYGPYAPPEITGGKKIRCLYTPQMASHLLQGR